MEITKLAAKQKRSQEWQKLLDNEVYDQNLKKTMSTILDIYRKVLVECWEQGGVSSSHEEKINSLERKLDDFCEQARLIVAAR